MRWPVGVVASLASDVGHRRVGGAAASWRMATSFILATLIITLALAASCSDGPAPPVIDEAARPLVEAVEEARVPATYQFTYNPLGPVAMTCLAGAERVLGAVDAEHEVARFRPAGRPGEVLSLADGLLISRELLAVPSEWSPWVRVTVGPEPSAADVRDLADALGPSLSGLVAAGAWPADPAMLVQAALSNANTVTALAQDGRKGLSIAPDPERYEAELRDGVLAQPSDGSEPPIIEAWLDAGGVVERLVVRRSIDPHETDGFAMDFDYSETVAIDLPAVGEIVDVVAADLPDEPVPAPCQVEL